MFLFAEERDARTVFCMQLSARCRARNLQDHHWDHHYCPCDLCCKLSANFFFCFGILYSSYRYIQWYLYCLHGSTKIFSKIKLYLEKIFKKQVGRNASIPRSRLCIIPITQIQANIMGSIGCFNKNCTKYPSKR